MPPASARPAPARIRLRSGLTARYPAERATSSIYEAMRELARREPTFALHVHIGVSAPEAAIVVQNQLRPHLPLLLALSANSPFWQGRDTGLASARTPLFQAFPRVGIPRAFDSYDDYVETVDLLLRCDAFPEPTFLWWDVRHNPGSAPWKCASWTAERHLRDRRARRAHAVDRASRARGGRLHRSTIGPGRGARGEPLPCRPRRHGRAFDRSVAELRVPAREQLSSLLEAVRPHASDLGCEAAARRARRCRRDPAPPTA